MSFKLQIARDYPQRPATAGNKRVVFRFMTSPVEMTGGEHADGLVVAGSDGETELIETSVILRSIGYRGSPVDALPYDPVDGVVPNDRGRVVHDAGAPVAGAYVTGWIKRGPRGVIGTNRTCAQETVAQLWEESGAGVLERTVGDRESLHALMTERGVAAVDWSGWRGIDEKERRRGAASSRPRVKFVAIDEMLSAVRPGSAPS